MEGMGADAFTGPARKLPPPARHAPPAHPFVSLMVDFVAGEGWAAAVSALAL